MPGVLIQIKSKPEVALKILELKRLVDQYVFEQEKMSNAECDLMYTQIGAWTKLLHWRRENGFELSSGETQEEFMLGFLCLKIKEKEEGHFDEMLKLFKDKNINWRKFLGYAEAYSPGDFVRAQRMYLEYAAKHPEQEGLTT